jgi:hypothetical protein
LSSVGIHGVWIHAANTPEEPPQTVVLARPGIVYNVNGNNAITAYLSISNSGHAVAESVHWTIGVSVLGVAAGKGAFDDLGEPISREGPTSLPPNAPIVRHVSRSRPSDAEKRAQAVEDERTEKKGIFVFGRITYDSVGATWETAFCNIYSGWNMVTQRNSTDTIVHKAFTEREATPCPSEELNHGPRKIS